jgi:hypothetical protein
MVTLIYIFYGHVILLMRAADIEIINRNSSTMMNHVLCCFDVPILTISITRLHIGYIRPICFNDIGIFLYEYRY